jgi:hypothetical protein
LPGKTGVARVRVNHFDIRQVTVSAELLCALDLLKTPFYADDFACGADAGREQIETAPRAASDLDHLPTSANAKLVEQSFRIVGKFVGLSLQTLLLSPAVAQQIWIGFVHLSPSSGGVAFGRCRGEAFAKKSNLIAILDIVMNPFYHNRRATKHASPPTA